MPPPTPASRATSTSRAASRAAGTVRAAVLTSAAAFLATTLLATTSTAAPGGGHPPPPHAATRAAMEQAVARGAPGVLVTVTHGTRRWAGTAGVADRRTGRPPHPADHFRVGSITKTFTATLVLLLAAEGRLALEDTVERWLPGVVRGNGHDGRRITIRQLLNHTSGVYNYLNDPALHQIGVTWLRHRHDTWTTPQLLAVAFSQPPPAAPGQAYVYSNTNYLLAALIVEKVTGNTYEHELHRRILGPLRLKGTVSPGTRETLPQPSGRAYSTEQVQLPPPGVDVTEFNPSALRASGELVSTGEDLHRFYHALLTGRLLPRDQLREMTTTVSDGTDDHGLGLTRITTSCGTALWGQRGGGYGFEALAVSTREGDHRMTVYLNTDALAVESTAVRDIVDAEFCPRP
ncbi:serine hydrolase domain-containing protein [Streptomyces sp. 4N509B]|uniref:serine hydrolase domain-containing protein n=1 Tax=Streptomyces sp. 4N509B TaxID=3457413 RepID=UPI003FD35C80